MMPKFTATCRHRYRARSKSKHNRDGTFPSACEGFDPSVIAAVEPAPVHRRVPYTFADVPLNAGRLVVSQVASTARQEHQRRSQERGFDDGEHARDSLFIGSRWLPLQQARRCGRRHPPCPQKMDTTIHRRQAKTWPSMRIAGTCTQNPTASDRHGALRCSKIATMAQVSV